MAPTVQWQADRRRRKEGPMMYAESHPWAVVASPWVVVARGGRWNTVDLRRLYTVDRSGVPTVNLADIWVASGLSGDLFALAFDFLDAYGRSASYRGEPRLESARFVKGWLEVETRDVTWDEEEQVPGHWHMRGMRTVVAVSPSRARSAARW
jgi:hypothetical protein